MNTKHTDSVDPWDTFIDELEPFDVWPQVMNRLCSHFRNTLKATQSQQVEEAVMDIIKMADALELECGKDGDKGTKQWMAFKLFRNTIRDKYLTFNHQD